MTIITDSDLHDSLCQICIESPHSLLSELGYAAKQKIIETTVCISYKKGDLIYQEGDMPTGLHCLLTGKAKIYKEGIGGRQQIVRMAKPIGFRQPQTHHIAELFFIQAKHNGKAVDLVILRTALVLGNVIPQRLARFGCGVAAFNIVQEDVGKLLFFLCQAGKGLMQFSFCLFYGFSRCTRLIQQLQVLIKAAVHIVEIGRAHV